MRTSKRHRPGTSKRHNWDQACSGTVAVTVKPAEDEEEEEFIRIHGEASRVYYLPAGAHDSRRGLATAPKLLISIKSQVLLLTRKSPRTH